MPLHNSRRLPVAVLVVAAGMMFFAACSSGSKLSRSSTGSTPSPLKVGIVLFESANEVAVGIAKEIAALGLRLAEILRGDPAASVGNAVSAMKTMIDQHVSVSSPRSSSRMASLQDTGGTASTLTVGYTPALPHAEAASKYYRAPADSEEDPPGRPDNERRTW